MYTRKDSCACVIDCERGIEDAWEEGDDDDDDDAVVDDEQESGNRTFTRTQHTQTHGKHASFNLHMYVWLCENYQVTSHVNRCTRKKREREREWSLSAPEIAETVEWERNDAKKTRNAFTVKCKLTIQLFLSLNNSQVTRRRQCVERWREREREKSEVHKKHWARIEMICQCKHKAEEESNNYLCRCFFFSLSVFQCLPLGSSVDVDERWTLTCL